jgi:hypothetical protein
MSTSNQREPRLPRRAEELLDGWPAPSRGALAWEETASGIMARVRDTTIGSTPDELLAAPLPEEPGEGTRGAPEGSAPPASNAPLADEPSLAEIARAAVASSGAASREIAREAMIAAEAGRRSPPRDAPPPRAAPAVSAKIAGLQGRVARVSEPGRAAAKVAQLAPVPAEPSVATAHEAAAHSEHPGPASREARRWNPAVFGGAILAIAAAAALYVSTSRHAARDAQLTASPEASHATQGTPKAPSAPAERTEPTAQAAASAVPEPAQKLALDDLPVVAKSRPESMPAGSSAKESLAFHVKKEKSGEKQLVLEERPEAPAAANAMQAAPAAPPAQAPSSLAERPSTGAVQAAFGSVMIGARGCLAGQEEGMRATVTFEGKTGRVKSVALEGAAAGSPAESCVRAALMGARLSPFSEDTFAARVTVRPL